MALHDVAAELRDPHGKWTKGGAALKRMAGEARTSLAGDTTEEKIASIPQGKTVRINGVAVHHISDTKVRVGFPKPGGGWEYQYYGSRADAAKAVDSGRHLGAAGPPAPHGAPATERAVREVARPSSRPPPLTQIAHPKSLSIAASASRGLEDNKKMRREVLRASTIQARDTPELVSKTDVTITKAPHGKRGGTTLASHTGQGNTLHVKPEVLIGSNMESVRKANVGGWWVKTDAHHNLSDNVLIHEFGHGVHGLLMSKGIVQSGKTQPKTDLPAEHELWQGLADALGVARPEVASIPVTKAGPGGKGYETRIEDRMNVGQWLFRSTTQNAVAKQVGRYANENQNELMAELWTEYKLSSKPRAPAQHFGDWVTSQLRKAGGG